MCFVPFVVKNEPGNRKPRGGFPPGFRFSLLRDQTSLVAEVEAETNLIGIIATVVCCVWISRIIDAVAVIGYHVGTENSEAQVVVDFLD